MARLNFFERMEREIDYQKEYEKIENIILNENLPFSLEYDISNNFRNWRYRRNFTSFYELREYFGFTYSRQNGMSKYKNITGKVQNIERFLLYCEMIINVFIGARVLNEHGTINTSNAQTIMDTIKYDIEQIGFELFRIDYSRMIIVQKDPAATAVADVVEYDLAKEIISYNHHLLKGDIESKKAILKKIHDALEPKRKELRSINKTIESDFFYLVNSMNIRHNNCDSEDSKNYNEKFDKLSDAEKEKWYDEIYQEGLMAFLILEQVKRNDRINDFKSNQNIQEN